MKNIGVWVSVVLAAIICFFIYQNKSLNLENVQMKTGIEAMKDTVHNYRSKFGSQAGYIKTIEANKKTAISLLSIEKEKNKDLINLLDSTKNIKVAAQVETKTVYIYKDSEPDTLLKGVKFTRVLKDNEYVNEVISVDSNKLSRTLDYKDSYLFSLNKKDNKGWFTGSTLTTTVIPKNPLTKVTGLTSVSTVVDKRKIRLGGTIGPSILITPQGKAYGGFGATLGISF